MSMEQGDFPFQCKECGMVVFSRPGMSDSLWPDGPVHTRPPCPSPFPQVCPSSCPLHQGCHPAISSSDSFFSFCPQSLPASGTFPMSQLFVSDDQNTGASASASVCPNNIQNWFPLRLTGLIFLSKGLSEVFSRMYLSPAKIMKENLKNQCLSLKKRNLLSRRTLHFALANAHYVKFSQSNFSPTYLIVKCIGGRHQTASLPMSFWIEMYRWEISNIEDIT